VRRTVQPYLEILEDLIAGRIGPAEFRSRMINQFDRVDAGVHWVEEWGEDVYAVLDQMDGDAEVIYWPEAPKESYIIEEELIESSRRNLAYLHDALRRRGIES
jgi:hypothetical protein